MLKPLKFGLVGCGRIARRHADLLSQGLVEGATLGAVCDLDRDRSFGFAEKYRVPFYTDMAEMMDSENLDVVSVLTPSGYHAEHVIRLAAYKKPIVVEKPMALRLSDADQMIEACDQNGIKLFVVKQNRFNQPIVRLKDAVTSGRFGKLVLGTVRVRWCRTQEYYDQDPWRGTWGLDGGVLANQASHHIDLLEWLLGDVESVFAKSATALVNIETEDVAVAVLKFRNGALGLIEATTATRPKDLEGSISILGEKGSAEIGGFAVNETITWNFRDTKPDELENLARSNENPPNVYGFGHQTYLNHVVSCINTDGSALVDGLAGRKSLEVISALYESIETGKEVRLRFRPDRCRLGLT
jgi:predicted dehydrogenase